jgi:hypothetical protein
MVWFCINSGIDQAEVRVGTAKIVDYIDWGIIQLVICVDESACVLAGCVLERDFGEGENIAHHKCGVIPYVMTHYRCVWLHAVFSSTPQAMTINHRGEGKHCGYLLRSTPSLYSSSGGAPNKTGEPILALKLCFV